jgi:hypothetical protein
MYDWAFLFGMPQSCRLLSGASRLRWFPLPHCETRFPNDFWRYFAKCEFRNARPTILDDPSF